LIADMAVAMSTIKSVTSVVLLAERAPRLRRIVCTDTVELPIRVFRKLRPILPMFSYLKNFSLTLVVSVLAARLVVAGEPASTDYVMGDVVPIDEGDLRMITLQVLETNPLLSSSPGIKFSEARRSGLVMPSGQLFDTAYIVYYPHAESAGIKEAFQVHCKREIPSELWTCDHVEIRRYMQLDTQEFEVRVKGDIGREAALALIQATRGTAQASATDGSAVPDTAIIMFPANGEYLVIWGSDESHSEFAVEAHLRKGGNPANSADWETRIFQEEE